MFWPGILQKEGLKVYTIHSTEAFFEMVSPIGHDISLNVTLLGVTSYTQKLYAEKEDFRAYLQL